MNALYTLLIYPLELLFEVLFTVVNRIIDNPGFAIIILSLAVNFLVLPLYNRADAVQKEEREIEDALADGIARIKKAFKGDERMMMLQAYYRENHYSPLFVLKSSVSLLLQIPFFIAAYNFLSNLALLQGTPFGPINDLGAPDRMIRIGALTVNVLPILMTLINFISGIIYTRGQPLRSKLQLYGMALIFLFLLYNSPSALAFYWTLNNLFSLVKNIFYKLKRPGFVFAILCAVTGVLGTVWLNTFYYTPYTSRRIRLTVIALALIVPLIVCLIKGKTQSSSKINGLIPEYNKHDRNIFIISGVFLSVLTGLLIPSAVVKISPYEFMDLMNLKTPVIYILNAFLIAFGTFVIWGGVFFALAGGKWRVLLSRLWLVLCPVSLITYLFFDNDIGDISVNFVYFRPFDVTLQQKLINLALILVASGLVLFLCRKFTKICEELILTLAVVSLIVSIINMIPINAAYKVNLNKLQNEFPQFTLSTEGQNVMVIMLDRAPGYLVPIVFDELPQLYDQFDGFTFYPNTLSFGNRTKFGAPAIFGGYEYTPEAINADTTRTLVQTQNEALSVMPIIFRDEGYEVTLLDPPNAGYMNPSDLSVFTGPLYEGISAYHTKGVVMNDYYKFDEYQAKIWHRNFFCYSMFRITPLFFQTTVYNEGNYNRPEAPVDYESEFTIPQVGFSESSSGGVDRDFMSAYEALSKLDEITEITNESVDTFMYMDNDTPHDAMLLQAPEYIPFQYVDNIQYDIDHADRFADPINGYYLDMDSYENMRIYSSNCAAYLQLGRYFDYMRQQGVWDNTRIIIVADHSVARGDANMFGGQLDLGGMCIDSFNPVLMVKDFGSSGFTTDESIMTNADVPFLATDGIISDPVNPFTGNPITMDGVHDMPLLVLDSNDWSIAGPDSLRFAEDDWYAFNGTQILDRDSWEFDGTR